MRAALALVLFLAASTAAQPRPSEISFADGRFPATPGQPAEVLVVRGMYTSYEASAIVVAGPAAGFDETSVNVTFGPGEVERRLFFTPGPEDVRLRLTGPHNATLAEPHEAWLDVPGRQQPWPAWTALALAVLARRARAAP